MGTGTSSSGGSSVVAAAAVAGPKEEGRAFLPLSPDQEEELLLLSRGSWKAPMEQLAAVASCLATTLLHPPSWSTALHYWSFQTFGLHCPTKVRLGFPGCLSFCSFDKPTESSYFDETKILSLEKPDNVFCVLQHFSHLYLNISLLFCFPLINVVIKSLSV